LSNDLKVTNAVEGKIVADFVKDIDWRGFSPVPIANLIRLANSSESVEASPDD